MTTIGESIYKLATELWPINRSITGDGVRQTLGIIQRELPELRIFEVPSGTKVFDWVIPKEWKVSDAYLITPNGKKICDFSRNNLHLVGYSIPVSLKLNLHELQKHLYSLPNQPSAIPYITSYYKEWWGFCIPHEERLNLEDGEYEVVIDSQLFEGNLTYGELLIKGDSTKEVFISTYVCHPSMANNELSGISVTTFLAKRLLELGRTRYSYRIVFIPETIGSITYLSRNIETLKQNVVAGFNVSCVGDNRDYSYLPSRNGETLSDITAKHVLKFIYPSFKSYSWRERGSDERQYCAPGVDLPIASIMRTKYGMYDEYHTSLDNLIEVVTVEGLDGGFKALWCAIEALEKNVYPKVTILCEPKLDIRGLYPALSTKTSKSNVQQMMDLISWSDGKHSLIDIAELCNCPIWNLYNLVEELINHKIVQISDVPWP